MPGSTHAWPNSAACWSPAMPLTGTDNPAATDGSVIPNRPDDGMTSGRHDAGTSNNDNSSGDHACRPMSHNIVRLAFDGSVACTPVSFHNTHASTVPNARFGCVADTPPSCSSHDNFDAEKYGSSTSPVSSRMRGSTPSAFSSSQR